MDLIRHIDVVDPNKYKKPIHVIGAGATGSWIVLALSKLGFKNIIAYDFDVIEEHNLANQCYKHEDVGKLKVIALGEICENFGMPITTKSIEVSGDEIDVGIVIILTDTMQSRSDIYNKIKLKPQIDLIIETRMGYNMGMVYSLTPGKISEMKRYEETLYSDEEVGDDSPSACGASSTVIGTCLGITQRVIWSIINFINGEDLPNENIIDIQNDFSVQERW